MLGLQDEDDDDNHLCIRCNATIIGLDNYVHHRKNLCNKIKPKSIENEGNLGADVFFQSLQLQSSVKRPAPVRPIPSSSKIGSGVLTRRATAAILATPKDLYTSDTSSILSEKRGEDWIGGHSLKVTGCEDNQSKLIKAVANISSSSTKKDHHISNSFALLDVYKQDEDSSEDSDECEDIDLEIDHPQEGGKWKPIPTNVGGKWKPIESGRDSATHWTSVVVTPEPDHIDEWEEEHTGGKWKPFLNTTVDSLRMDEDDYDSPYVPPPNYTKGKWIPGAKDGLKSDHKAQIMDAMALHKEGGSVQYWCGPCNRRLGSRVIYDRHLNSKLHLKRTLPEKDLEYSGTLHNIESNKRIIKSTGNSDEFYYFNLKKTNRKSKSIDLNQSMKHKRNRRPTFIICLVCKYKVKPYLMGKHLISHYHFRKGNLNDEFNKTQILDNISKIILQSPFQCNPCKFYANWQAEFMRHWRTGEHKKKMEDAPGKYWCSFCKFECDAYDEITEHLSSDDHQEVIAAINRSIPIVIRKRAVINCPNCKKEFKYNVQLKRHIKSYCSVVNTSTASEGYQGWKVCKECLFKCKNKTALSRHMKAKHNKQLYYCSACSMEFSNSKEAKEHRNSQEHRIKEKELRQEKGFEMNEISRSCPHCDSPKFKNIIELKKHIQDNHKDRFSSCSVCGMKFALPQEVTWHLRNKACVFDISEQLPAFEEQMWSCGYCPFVAPSHAEVIYHEVLHGDPVKSCSGKDIKYSCPLCHKLFSKHSLRCHLRRHTNERPHACNICGAKFFRVNNLVFHMKKIHGKEDTKEQFKPLEREKEKKPATSREFLCSECGASFMKKFNLQQHATTHTGRNYVCSEEGCLYKGRNWSELRRHAASHSNLRPHHCQQCNYSAKTLFQLKRHSIVHSADKGKNIKCPLCPFTARFRARLENHLSFHSDQKPFACRYCPFTCNSLENLRKHVLSRNIHKNVFLYECEFCTSPEKYTTNYAKEFRIHLTTNHTSLYPDVKSTVTYVADYLKEERSEESQSNQGVPEVEPTDAEKAMQFDRNADIEIVDSKHFLQLDEYPTEGCYSVTETGKLVPYLDK